MENFGEKLKEWRNEKNLTQTQVAEALFVSRQAVSNWENNKNTPDITSLVGLSRLYGYSLDEMLIGEQKVVKEMQKELRSINGVDLVGVIVLIVLSFIIPVLGMIASIILLVAYSKKRVDAPKWLKPVAILGIVYNIVALVVVIFGVISFNQIEQHIENQGTVEILEEWE